MDKTEKNIAIARIAFDLAKSAESSPATLHLISDKLTGNSALIDVFDALYERLKQQLTEE
ncbi:hypothetical protein I2492_06015 [Budviciaceae bacterium CWB-B4]|uniref:Uncharacterized protein n=1 Tax=Limnobaculum xujianqingii TaxID=2738837 RepID=A0A9D7AH09_9GAMM|nr:hypothetical protein [Limnobaculum xujianqingii]MBK5072564.1 hypothetical protein [Limnobaculum xujianqingii]MBK5175873.1 hypothetical protein [Limnobaculum xujianqingii]